ncbi:MAG: molybdopterin-synthase adenylyltransferase MoeB [Saprospiraceae bacterium]|nr:molybdopterin-synthase adenylyltransferase MoeB [Saprospiraceae bacterium]
MEGYSFSKEELNRYARHFAIPEFGLAGQEKLKQSKVLVVGAGGLGSPVLLYLAAAGVGKIGIVDFDVVDTSNLQRQVLYTVADVGESKAQLAKKRILAMNPHIEVEVYQEAFTRENALELVSQYDVVADGTDNFPTRYLVNDACVLAGKVNVYASIFRFEGQVSVFNLAGADGSRGPNYRDLFPEPPPPDMVPNCAEGGVLGVLPGIIGSLQASEVIKVVTGVGEPLSGRLFLFDAAAFSTRVLKFPINPNLEIKELIDYEEFCGIPKPDEAVNAFDLSVEQLHELAKQPADFLLLDVREAYEFATDQMGGKLIPLDTLADALPQLNKDQRIIVHCRSGKRSLKAARLLQKNGFGKVHNLLGGILAWREVYGKQNIEPKLAEN